MARYSTSRFRATKAHQYQDHTDGALETPVHSQRRLLVVPGGQRLPSACPLTESEREIVRDPSRPSAQRIEALQGIIESEVGDTLLMRARNLERKIGLRQVYLKFEGGNPTGTHKDRIAFAEVTDALRRGFDTLTVGTCGSTGLALAFACSLSGLKCTLFVPAAYHACRTDEMEAFGAVIKRVPTDYEGAVAMSREHADKEQLYDANPGGHNTSLQLMAYARIAHEIVDDLGDAPSAVSVPVGNGTTLAGIYRGFLSLYRRGKTSRIPRMVAGSSFGNNAITSSYIRKADNCMDLPPEVIHETVINEPLLNWHSTDGDLALEAIRKTDGWAEDLSDNAMLSYARTIRCLEGLSVLPASSAALLALLNRHNKQPLAADRYVAIMTGKK